MKTDFNPLMDENPTGIQHVEVDFGTPVKQVTESSVLVKCQPMNQPFTEAFTEELAKEFGTTGARKICGEICQELTKRLLMSRIITR